MVGASRKSFIGNYLNLAQGERDTASAIVDTLALKNGAKIIRTHNVKNGIMTKQLFGRLN
jgi:dihydropteroate synthase